MRTLSEKTTKQAAATAGTWTRKRIPLRTLVLAAALLPASNVLAQDAGSVSTPWLLPSSPADRAAPGFATDPLTRDFQLAAADDPSRGAGTGTGTGAGTGTGLKPAEAPVWGENKSYVTPALGILGFQFLLNRFNNVYFGCCEFDVSASSIERNLERSWVTDKDSFTVNQLGHPYQGSVYHGLARASGLGFWPAFGYTVAGSAIWEIAGETTPPSRNDQITTSLGGTFLGEALFRMSNLWLERGQGSRFWREVAAAAISPPVGFNRLAFGERFDAIYSSRNAEIYSRANAGVSYAAVDRRGPGQNIDRAEAAVEFALDYGLPGKPGYEYRRPFDYFTFQAGASTGVGFEHVMTRGLLFGATYGEGRAPVRGIWGLYGNYDYIAPQIFRFSTSGVSLGTTLEWRPSAAIAVQGTGLLGVGYASVSTVRGIPSDRDNTYGVAPQALVAMRVIFADKASLDLTAREYFVSDLAAGPRAGDDNVMRADAALTWRLHRQHAVSVRYQFSRRDAEFAGLGDRTQSRGTIGIYYTLLGRDRFGTGDWR